jgi:hypothetical protein
MTRQTITKEQMLTRVAKFKDLVPSGAPAGRCGPAAVHRQIFNIIGAASLRTPP